MKVGLYFDLRLPSGCGRDPARVYAHALEMCEEAERAGLDSIWISEHHGFEDGYLPQALTFAAAVAARTARVRIGTALVVAPLHATVEIAEQAAVVDLLSGGRLELGLGAGYRQAEFDLYGADRSARFATLARQVVEIRELWAGERGRVTPSPVQSPIPIWLGSGGEHGVRRAGRLGADLLFLNPGLLPAYRQGRSEAGLDPAGGRMGGPFFALPSEDPEREWPLIAPYITYQQDSYRRHTDVRSGELRPFDADAGRQRDLSRPGAFWFDTPESLTTRLAAWLGGCPVDTVFLWASVGGMPEALVERNVQLIAHRLAPLLRSVGDAGVEGDAATSSRQGSGSW